jgi:hypothetical protein
MNSEFDGSNGNIEFSEQKEASDSLNSTDE